MTFFDCIPLRELTKANLSIGKRYQARTIATKPKAWLRWLLSFSERDLTKITEGDWLNLQNEVGAFVFFDLVGNNVLDADFLEEYLSKKDDPKGQVWSGEIPSRETTIELQENIGSTIDQLLTNGYVNVQPIRVEFFIRRETRTTPPMKASYFRQLLKGGFKDRAMHRAATLLGEFAAMIERCPEIKCMHLFLADRTNQRYCSTRCQSRAASRQYREKGHRETLKSKKMKGVKHGKKIRKR